MAKAMLIMEMPINCLHCSCSTILHGKSRCEEIGENLTVDDIYEERPTWCPLREAPQKMEKYHKHDAIALGYNACIDEILGGTE